MQAGPAIGLVGVGLQVAGTLSAAKGRSDSLSFEADKAERAARAGRIAADQTDAAMRDELESTIGQIRAIRASSNSDLNSPTGLAIEEGETARSDRQRSIRVGNIRMQADEDERSAGFLRRSARSALNTGYLAAAGVGLKGIAAR